MGLVAIIKLEIRQFLVVMEAQMRSTYTLSRFGIMKTIILITFAGMALQIRAADENQPAAAAPGTTVQQDAAKTDDAAVDQQEPMEEITVIGQKQIMGLRQQIFRAEDHAFEIFNALNDDNDYDVHCRMVANTGTRIERRTCMPNFYHDATANEAQQFLAYMGVINYAAAVPSARNVFAQKFPIFKEKVKKAAKENPEMLAALKKLFELNEELVRERNTYHGLTDK